MPISTLYYRKKELQEISDNIWQYDQKTIIDLIEKLIHDNRKLMDENSMLCPIAEFDTITSLVTEKQFMMDEVKRLQTINDQSFQEYLDLRQRHIKTLKALESIEFHASQHSHNDRLLKMIEQMASKGLEVDED